MKDPTQPIETTRVTDSRQLDEQAGTPTRRLPRWLSKLLLIVIVAAIISGFILGLLVIAGQVLRPGAVGLQAALSMAGSLFVMSLVVVGWKVLRGGGPARAHPDSTPDPDSKAGTLNQTDRGTP